jgi:hypothetical protein
MTPLTSAQCLAIAERKIGEATGDRRYGKELETTARAWLVLAERIEQGERLAVQDSGCRAAHEHQIHSASQAGAKIPCERRWLPGT